MQTASTGGASRLGTTLAWAVGLFAATVASAVPGLLGGILVVFQVIPRWWMVAYVVAYGVWALAVAALAEGSARRQQGRALTYAVVVAFALGTAVFAMLVMRTHGWLREPVAFVLLLLPALLLGGATFGVGLLVAVIGRALGRHLARPPGADGVLDGAAVMGRAGPWLVLGAIAGGTLCWATSAYFVAIGVALAGAGMAVAGRPRRLVLVAFALPTVILGVRGQLRWLHEEREYHQQRVLAELPACGDVSIFEEPVRAIPDAGRVFIERSGMDGVEVNFTAYVGLGAPPASPATLAAVKLALERIACRDFEGTSHHFTVLAAQAAPHTLDVRIVPSTARAPFTDGDRALLETQIRDAFAARAVAVKTALDRPLLTLPSAKDAGVAAICYRAGGRDFIWERAEPPLVVGQYPSLATLHVEVVAARAPVVIEDDGFANRCGEIAARFANARNAGSGRCDVAADCACHPELAPAWTSRVSDRATVAALDKIAAGFHEAKCPLPVPCDPSPCMTRCVDHRCTR